MVKHLISATILLLLFLTACNDSTHDNTHSTETESIASISYTLDSVTLEPDIRSYVSWDITNLSTDTWRANEWSLHYNQISGLPIASSVTTGYTHKHVNGDYNVIHYVDTLKDISPGESVKISLTQNGIVRRMSQVPLGVFIVNNGQVFDIKNVDVLGVDNETLALLNPTTAADLYDANALYNKQDIDIAIIPRPQSILRKDEVLTLDNITIEVNEEEIDIDIFTEELSKYFDGNINVGNNGNIKIGIDPLMAKTEGYKLTIGASDINIIGTDAAGVFYALRTLTQLIDPYQYNEAQSSIELPLVTIEDYPRFEYRGFMLDVGRNFHKKEKVKEVIDLMSMYKLNKFHFHLMDDEGWRLEIDGLPELTEVGSVRGYTIDESDRLHPSYGSGGMAKNSYSTGYYTREDYIEIIQYAHDRHIEIIPEIDIPGHARAAIISMRARYNRLMEAGKEKEALEYVLHDPADTSRYSSAQLYTDNVINLCQSSAYNFIEKVINETIQLHEDAGVPLKILHTGGDEVPFGAWKGSPLCQSFLSDMENLSGTEDLHPNMLSFIRSLLTPKGITTAGWEEIALKHTDQGHNGTAINEKLINESMLPYVWNAVTGWGREDMAYKLANVGYDVIMCNSSAYYFDLAYNGDSREGGLSWSGLNNSKIIFDCEPLDIFDGVSTDVSGRPLAPGYIASKEKLNANAISRIKGLQAQLWSETLLNESLVDYMLLPKLLPFADRAWSQSLAESGLDRNESFGQLVNMMGQSEFIRLDQYKEAGLQYRIPSPGIKKVGQTVLMNTQFPGLTIRYTTDGSEPNETSSEYTGSIDIQNGTTLRAKCFASNGRASRPSVLKL